MWLFYLIGFWWKFFEQTNTVEFILGYCNIFVVELGLFIDFDDLVIDFHFRALESVVLHILWTLKVPILLLVFECSKSKSVLIFVFVTSKKSKWMRLIENFLHVSLFLFSGFTVAEWPVFLCRLLSTGENNQ